MNINERDISADDLAREIIILRFVDIVRTGNKDHVISALVTMMASNGPTDFNTLMLFAQVTMIVEKP